MELEEILKLYIKKKSWYSVTIFDLQRNLALVPDISSQGRVITVGLYSM